MVECVTELREGQGRGVTGGMDRQWSALQSLRYSFSFVALRCPCSPLYSPKHGQWVKVGDAVFYLFVSPLGLWSLISADVVLHCLLPHAADGVCTLEAGKPSARNILVRLRSWAERKAADPEIACASIKSCSCSATPWIGGVVGCKVVMRDWDFDACQSAWFSYRWSVPGGFSSRLVFVTPSGKALLGLAAVRISDWPMRVSCIIWAPASLGTLRCSVRCRQFPAAAAKFRLLAYASVAAGSLSSQLALLGSDKLSSANPAVWKCSLLDDIESSSNPMRHNT